MLFALLTCPLAGGARETAKYLERGAQAGLQGIQPFGPHLRGHPALLTRIHGDESDLPPLKRRARESMPFARIAALLRRVGSARRRALIEDGKPGMVHRAAGSG